MRICAAKRCTRIAIEGETLCDPCLEREEEGQTVPRNAKRTSSHARPKTTQAQRREIVRRVLDEIKAQRRVG